MTVLCRSWALVDSWALADMSYIAAARGPFGDLSRGLALGVNGNKEK